LFNSNEGGTRGLLTTLLQTMRERFGRPLSIILSNRELRFRRFEDFEFCLAPRTAVPALRFNALFGRPSAAL